MSEQRRSLLWNLTDPDWWKIEHNRRKAIKIGLLVGATVASVGSMRIVYEGLTARELAERAQATAEAYTRALRAGGIKDAYILQGAAVFADSALQVHAYGAPFLLASNNRELLTIDDTDLGRHPEVLNGSYLGFQAGDNSLQIVARQVRPGGRYNSAVDPNSAAALLRGYGLRPALVQAPRVIVAPRTDPPAEGENEKTHLLALNAAGQPLLSADGITELQPGAPVYMHEGP